MSTFSALIWEAEGGLLEAFLVTCCDLLRCESLRIVSRSLRKTNVLRRPRWRIARQGMSHTFFQEIAESL